LSSAATDVPMQVPTNSHKALRLESRLRSLDGLRALSIALVFLGHLSGTRGFGNVDLGVGNYAHLGVVVFFVISGFLITTHLFEEHAKNGRISLKLFYARRALRIFPASYCYLGCIVLLVAVGLTHWELHGLWPGITYTENYFPNPAWQVGHLWSLSVEEQFYLVWPFVVVWLLPRRASLAAAAVLVIGPISRFAAWFFLRRTPYGDLAMFPVVADSLATGCLLAWMRPWLEARNWYLWLFKPAVSGSILVLVFLLNRYLNHTVVEVFGTSVINVSLAVLIHRSVYHSYGLVGRLLNLGAVRWVGILSYSLYIWQQPFLDRSSASWICAFPQNLILALVAAVCSYFILEKPLLRLRHRLRSPSPA